MTVQAFYLFFYTYLFESVLFKAHDLKKEMLFTAGNSVCENLHSELHKQRHTPSE